MLCYVMFELLLVVNLRFYAKNDRKNRPTSASNSSPIRSLTQRGRVHCTIFGNKNKRERESERELIFTSRYYTMCVDRR